MHSNKKQAKQPNDQIPSIGTAIGSWLILHYIALLALSEITSVRLCGLLFWYTGGFPARTTCPPVKVTTSPPLSLNLLPRGAGPLPAAFLPNSQQQEEELPVLSASTVVQIGGQGVEESRPAVVHILVWRRKRGSGVHLRSPRTKRAKMMPARFID